MVTVETDVECIRPCRTAEYHEYERSTEERGVLQEVRHLGLSLSGVVNRPKVMHDWRHPQEKQRYRRCVEERIDAECEGETTANEHETGHDDGEPRSRDSLDVGVATHSTEAGDVVESYTTE